MYLLPITSWTWNDLWKCFFHLIFPKYVLGWTKKHQVDLGVGGWRDLIFLIKLHDAPIWNPLWQDHKVWFSQQNHKVGQFCEKNYVSSSSVFPRASVNLLIFKSWDVYHHVITLVSTPLPWLTVSWGGLFFPSVGTLYLDLLFVFYCYMLTRAGNQRESCQIDWESQIGKGVEWEVG